VVYLGTEWRYRQAVKATATAAGVMGPAVKLQWVVSASLGKSEHVSTARAIILMAVSFLLNDYKVVRFCCRWRDSGTGHIAEVDRRRVRTSHVTWRNA
jgi:hypothetical protein